MTRVRLRPTLQSDLAFVLSLERDRRSQARELQG